MPSKNTGLRGTESQAKTRVLLALWDLGADKQEVKKGDLAKRVQQSDEKVGDYQGIFQKLEDDGAIAAVTKNRSVKMSLTPQGLQMLDTGLKSPDFEFVGRQVRSKDVKALLKWIREMGMLTNGATTSAMPAKAGNKAIASYDEFKPVALEVYDRLNRDYNLDDLVPIYRIRREIGERVTRSQFNDWMLEMQANDIIQLIGGEMPDITPDKAEDSIKTKLGAIRYYVKRLSA